MEISMARVVLRSTRYLSFVAAAALLLGGPATVRAQKAPATYGQHSNTWTTKHGVRFETRSTDWHGGKKAEWERRITGKSGVTKINGVMWGSRVKGTARTFKNGNSVEHLKVFGTDGVRRITTRTLKDGKILKTIRLPDGSRKEITTWVEKGEQLTERREFDPNGQPVVTEGPKRSSQ
jgi:hypothetical protein